MPEQHSSPREEAADAYQQRSGNVPGRVLPPIDRDEAMEAFHTFGESGFMSTLAEEEPQTARQVFKSQFDLDIEERILSLHPMAPKGLEPDADTQPVTAVEKAARAGRLKDVKFLLSEQGGPFKGDPSQALLHVMKAFLVFDKKYPKDVVEPMCELLIGARADCTVSVPVVIRSKHMHSMDMLTLLLKQGIDIECDNVTDGYPPLLLAAAVRDAGAVSSLIEEGANVNRVGPDSRTPLIAAVSSAYGWVRMGAPKGAGGMKPAPGVVALLIQAKADVKTRDDFGMQAIHHAAWCCDHMCAKALIKHRAAVNTRDKSGWSPLHYALVSGEKGLTVVELLLENGADVASAHRYVNLLTVVERSPGGSKLLPLLWGALAEKAMAIPEPPKKESEIGEKSDEYDFIERDPVHKPKLQDAEVQVYFESEEARLHKRLKEEKQAVLQLKQEMQNKKLEMHQLATESQLKIDHAEKRSSITIDQQQKSVEIQIQTFVEKADRLASQLIEKDMAYLTEKSKADHLEESNRKLMEDAEVAYRESDGWKTKMLEAQESARADRNRAKSALAELYVKALLEVDEELEAPLYTLLVGELTKSGLPEGWSEQVHADGRVFFWNGNIVMPNGNVGYSTWDHPFHQMYTEVVRFYRAGIDLMNAQTGGEEALAELLGQVLQRHAREMATKKIQWVLKQTRDCQTWFHNKELDLWSKNDPRSEFAQESLIFSTLLPQLADSIRDMKAQQLGPLVRKLKFAEQESKLLSAHPEIQDLAAQETKLLTLHAGHQHHYEGDGVVRPGAIEDAASSSKPDTSANCDLDSKIENLSVDGIAAAKEAAEAHLPPERSLVSKKTFPYLNPDHDSPSEAAISGREASMERSFMPSSAPSRDKTDLAVVGGYQSGASATGKESLQSAALATLSPTGNSIQAVRERYKKMDQEKSMFEQRIANLEHDLLEQMQFTEDAKRARNEAQLSRDEFEAQVKNLTLEKDIARQGREAIEEMMKTTRQDLFAKASEVVALQTMNAQLEDEIKRGEIKMKAWPTAEVELNRRLENYVEKIGSLEDERDRLRSENNTLSETNRQLEETNGKLNSSYLQRDKEVAERDGTIFEQRKAVDEWQEISRHKGHELEQLVHKHSAVLESNKEFERRVRSLQHQLEEVLAEQARVKDRHERDRRDWDEKIRWYRDENDDLHKREQHYVARIRAIEAGDMQKLQGQVQELARQQSRPMSPQNSTIQPNPTPAGGDSSGQYEHTTSEASESSGQDKLKEPPSAMPPFKAKKSFIGEASSSDFGGGEVI